MTRGLPIRGACPMGCGPTLIRGLPDGAVLCSSPDCPRPSAAHEVLSDKETEHVVELREHAFTIRHPLRDRLDDALMTCDVHTRLAASDGPPLPPGRYRLTIRGDTWSWDDLAGGPLPDPPSPALERLTAVAQRMGLADQNGNAP